MLVVTQSDLTFQSGGRAQLQKLLEKKKIPYEIRIYPGAGHGFEGEAI